MNIDDYKNVNGQIENSEELIEDIVGAINGVVESGSNDNGHWVKFADGTQMCWGQRSYTYNIPAGGFFVIGNIPYASAFIASPRTFLNDVASSSYAFHATLDSVTSTQMQAVKVVNRYVNAINVAHHVHFFAIGRWK